jgi:pyridoxine 5-phosphate synthase
MTRFQALRLGVNIDHVATVRNARGGNVPDPVRAALIAERAGADGITAHLREDRRHITDDDISRLQRFVSDLGERDIRVSLFIEPDLRQLDAAKRLGAPVVELHTGAYCEAAIAGDADAVARHLRRLETAARHGASLGLEVHAGHGLAYDTVRPVAAIREIVELNIGHFLIGEAIFVGLEQSVRRMRALMDEAREPIGVAAK